MAYTVNTSEGGVSGATVTTADTGSGTAWSTVTPGAGGTITYTTDAYYNGKLATLLTPAAGVACYVERSIVGARSGSLELMIKIPSYPSAAQTFLRVLTGSANTVFSLILQTAGGIAHQDFAGTTSAATTGVLPVNQWTRISVQWSNPSTTTGTFNAAMYLGDSSTAITNSTIAITNANQGTSNAVTLRVGKITTSGTWASIVLDDVQYSDGVTTALGPMTVPVPDVSFVATRATVANTTAETTTAVDLAAGASIAVGNFLIIRVACDNSGTNGAAPTVTVSDTHSNVYVNHGPANVDPGVAAEGATLVVAIARVTTGFANGDDITVTFGSSTTAKAIVVEEWSASFDITTPVVVAAVTGTGTSTTPTFGPITPTAAGQLVYMAAAVEGTFGDVFTLDNDTTAGTWAALTSYATSNATAISNITNRGAVKRVSGVNSQTFNATATSRDWAGLVLVLKPPTVTTIQLATPTGFTMTKTAGVRQIVFSWSSVENAVDYDVEVQVLTGSDPNNEADWTAHDIYTTTGTTLSIDDTDLIDWDETYRGRVTAKA